MVTYERFGLKRQTTVLFINQNIKEVDENPNIIINIIRKLFYYGREPYAYLPMSEL